MSNNQKEAQAQAQLKANMADFVEPLLKCLKLANEKVPENSEMANIIDEIRTEVVKAKVSIDSIKNWDRELIGHFGKIERHISSWIDHDNRMIEMDESTIETELRNILNQSTIQTELMKIAIETELMNILYQLYHKPGEKVSNLPQEDKIADTESSNTRYEEKSMDLKDREALGVHCSLCLYSLGIFPVGTEFKRRFVIYWWTGLGLLPWVSWENAEQRAGEIFSVLVQMGFLKPIHIREHNQAVNHYTINSTIHKCLFAASQENVLVSYEKKEDFILPFFGEWFNTKVQVNLNQRYLNSKEISNKHNCQVVQLGSWRYTETGVPNRVDKTWSKKANSNDHIEVDGTDFLKNLGEEVIFLSLRGISGIEEVDESIGNLENLMILDLRACHNLNKLPQKPRPTIKEKLIRWKLPQQRWFQKLIGLKLPQKSWFKKLMVLDISECYLLDHMPKWVSELSNLEVLKGFVVGSAGNNSRSCRLSDLSKLNKLRKLTIRITRDHLGTEDFSGLKPLHKLLVLTIIWGENKSNCTIPANSFPENLEKLDMRCYPEAEASELLNPEELKCLKKLYIRGGKLTKIPFNGNWEVEILRLRFLKKLHYPTKWEELRTSFTKLKYVEYVECPKPMNFPENKSSWINKEKEEPYQSASASETSN